MENNTETEMRQQTMDRKATAEKSIWNAKLFFEVLTVVAILALMISIYILVGHQNPKDPEGPMSVREWFDYYDHHEAQARWWIVITIGTVVLTCICGTITSRLDYYCGGYRCEKCGGYHIPTQKDISGSFGIGNRRYLTCPACKEKSWQTKMLAAAETVIDKGKQAS